MSYILFRTRRNERQMFMDSFRIDIAGVWRDPIEPYSGINLPRQFEELRDAIRYRNREREKDPNWHYEIREYL